MHVSQTPRPWESVGRAVGVRVARAYLARQLLLLVCALFPGVGREAADRAEDKGEGPLHLFSAIGWFCFLASLRLELWRVATEHPVFTEIVSVLPSLFAILQVAELLQQHQGKNMKWHLLAHFSHRDSYVSARGIWHSKQIKASLAGISKKHCALESKATEANKITLDLLSAEVIYQNHCSESRHVDSCAATTKQCLHTFSPYAQCCSR